jgi:hypothetical protein
MNVGNILRLWTWFSDTEWHVIYLLNTAFYLQKYALFCRAPYLLENCYMKINYANKNLIKVLVLLYVLPLFLMPI